MAKREILGLKATDVAEHLVFGMIAIENGMSEEI